MRINLMQGIALACALTFAGTGVAGAQSAVDGAIGGTIQDAGGAVIPGATIVIHSNQTNAEQTLTSDSSGYFRVIHLQPSTYTVSITANGFGGYKSPEVIVQVGLLTDVSPKLPVGGASQTVEVTSAAPAVNTTSPDFAGLIDQHQLQDLPVNNYRWSAYAALTPGVVVDSSGFGLLSFRGQSTLLNNVTIDGADDNQAYFSEERGRTRAGYSTAKAAIQEFQVNTSNYSVEYGRSAGGVVNSVTKSGGNQFHGELYFDDRDQGWGAANSGTKNSVLNSSGQFVSQNFKPKDVRKQYGGAIGGPIWKDKVFFFFAGDRFDHNYPAVAIATTPSTFFATPDAVLPAGKTCGVTTGAAAPSAIDAAACTLSTNLGITYTAAVADYTSGLSGLNTMLGTVPRKGLQDIFFPKVDWQINAKNHASFEANRLRWAAPGGVQSASTVTDGIASFGNDYVRDTFGIAKLDTAVTSNISNEIRYQYGRDFEFEFNQTPTSYEQNTLVNSPGYSNPLGLPASVNITNGFTFGTPNFLNRAALPDERRFQIADTANWVRGKHNLKFGVDYLHTYDLVSNLFSGFGVYTYSSLASYFTDYYESQSANAATRAKAKSWSSFTQGFGIPGLDFTTSDYAGFIEDNWKANKRLSLTVGLRYEFEQMPSPVANLIVPAIPQTAKLPSNKTNIGPRVGFAYDVYGDGKTILRGGYGEFFARIINSTIFNGLISTGSLNGQFTVTPQSTTTSPTNPSVLIPNPLAPAFPQILPSALTAGPPNSVYFNSNFKAPEIHQFDLTLEHDFGWNTVMSVTYMGSFGRRLVNFTDTNLNTPKSVTYSVIDTSGKGPLLNGSTFTSKFYAKNGIVGCASGRPNCSFGSITDIFSGVTSNYQGLVTQLNHRFSHHLQFGGNYTWSHALDYGQNNQTGTSANNLLDPQDIKGEYGNSIQNTPNRLVLTSVMTSPWKFHGWMSYLLNDYEISPNYALQSGTPYSVKTSGTLSTAFTPTGNLSAIGGGINGSNGDFRLPGFERNGVSQPKTQTVDLRISKRFTVRDKYKLELLGESFNLLNKQNVTSVNTTGYFIGTTTNTAKAVTGNTLTFNTNSSNPLLPVFGTTSTVNASNFSFAPRQIQLAIRAQF